MNQKILETYKKYTRYALDPASAPDLLGIQDKEAYYKGYAEGLGKALDILEEQSNDTGNGTIEHRNETSSGS